MRSVDYIILGGGPAGLACAFYAARNQKSFIVLEKGSVVGGNALTFSRNQFLYDSGAHRWHNQNPNITQDIKNLLGDEFKVVQAESAIFHRGHYVAFPFRPTDLLLKLSPSELVSMAWSYFQRNEIQYPEGSFAEYAQKGYGKKLSEAFLWHYTEKLWGEKAEVLSNEMAGKRLKGLNLRALMQKNPEHLDGAFYYPDQGIGSIFQKITETLPESSLHLNQNITELVIENSKITKIKTSEGTIECEKSIVINTLGPDTTLALMKEKPMGLGFRSMDILFIALNRPSFSPYASIYYPQKEIAFTRIVEPKNRSRLMAPKDQTSLVLEIPGSGVETEKILEQFFEVTDIKESEILDRERRTLKMAYPSLTREALKKRSEYLSRMSKIENMKVLGRNARFSYLHLHDLFQSAKDLF